MKNIVVFLLVLLIAVNCTEAEDTGEKVVLIVLDGAGMMDLDLGVRGECEAVFPTLTRPNHASIITGVYPNRHGVLGNEYWENGVKKYTRIDAVTLFEILKDHGKESVVIAKDNICKLFGAYCETIVEEDPETVFKTIEKELREKDFVFVNIAILDHLGHKYGPNSDEVESARDELKDLFSEYPIDAVTIVTADHGMGEISKAVEITKYLQDYTSIALSEGRVCYIYNRDDEDIDFQMEGVEKVIEKRDFPEYHIDHANSPDMILTAKEGYAFLPGPLLATYKGMHGSLQEKTVVVTTNYKKEGTIECKMVDIAPWILEIFGISGDYEFDGEVPEIVEREPQHAPIIPYVLLGMALIGLIAVLVRRRSPHG
ncbi:MAG: alkaline phosphatase family protein [Euryarchaeota archaeon]|nr:alkaline phosphatase family protein [Euryarchaeota archaeon]